MDDIHDTPDISGSTLFASVMLVLGALLNVIEATLAWSRAAYFASDAALPVTDDVSRWAWVLLLLGLVEFGAAFGVASGRPAGPLDRHRRGLADGRRPAAVPAGPPRVGVHRDRLRRPGHLVADPGRRAAQHGHPARVRFPPLRRSTVPDNFHGQTGSSRHAGRDPPGRPLERVAGVDGVCADAAASTRPRPARGDPVDLRAELPRANPRAAARGLRRGRRAVPRGRRPHPRAAAAAAHRAGRARRDPGPAGRADRPPVQPLRRRAGRRRVEVAVAAVRRHRAGRRRLRPRIGRLEVEHPDARRRDPGLGGTAARRHQGRHRGAGGGRQRLHHLPADQPGRVRRGRDGDRRHGQPAARHRDADGRAARDGDDHRRGAHPRRAEAQRPVRRRRARRPRDPAAGARGPARRARRRRRCGAEAGGLDRRELQRRGVPPARRDRARGAVRRHGRARRAALDRPGADRHRDRRPAGQRRGQRGRPVRPGEAQPAGPPRAGPDRGPGRADRPPARAAPLRRAAHGARRGDRPRLRREHRRAGLRGRPGGPRRRLGRGGRDVRLRRLDPARERAADRGAEGRDAAARDDRRLRQHPRAERARPARRVRARGRRRGRLLRPLRRAGAR